MIHHKYDKGYKALLSIKKVFLHFLVKYLDQPWARSITVDDLELVKTDFLNHKYGYLESDLIYKLKRDDRDVYFYVLLELQSTPDFTMPYRLLKYMVELQDDVFENTDENERARKDFRLPAIVPIVFYNGHDNWNVVRTYREYVKDFDVFGDSIINFRYLLFDLKRVDEDTILSTKELLDIVFSLNKNMLDWDDVAGARKRLSRLVSGLKNDDLATLFRWLATLVYKGSAPLEIEEAFKQSIEKGDESTMKCDILEFIDRLGQEKLENTARKMLSKNMGIDEIVELTGLMVDDVLRLMSEGS